MVKLAKAGNQQIQKKKAPPPPKKVEEESSEEESSEEEDETPPPKVAKKATPGKATPAVKNGTNAKKAESDEDDDEDSEESSEEEAPPPPPKKTPAKATPAKKQAKAVPVKAEESDDEDDDESEEEAPTPKKATKPAAKPPAKATPAKESSDDDDEDDSEEEAPPLKKATPAKAAAKPAGKAAAKPAGKAAAKAQPAKESSEDDEEDSEEEMDTAPAPAATKAKKAGMVKAKEESEEEDDDDEEEESEEDDDDEEPPTKPAKRKAEGKSETSPAKKAKSEGEGFSLFVGNLNSDKDFDEIKSSLRKFFSKNSLEVVDVRLGGSRKFGYVDFATEEDLNKALEFNGKKIMGLEVRMDKAHSKDGAQEGKKERDARTLFVKNLPFSATVDDLKEVFENAVDVRLPPGQGGMNRGIAYIVFKTEAEAEKMMEEAQGAEVQGRSVIFDYVGDKSQKGARVSATGSANKTLVVNNLAFSATEEVLQFTFEKASSIRIPQRDGRPKGYAFIEFESTEDAKEALENHNNTDIEGRTIRLEYSQNSGGRDGGGSGPTKTLFVKGLSEDTTDQTLRDSFDGAVAARIVTDRETGSSKGFGFVDFDNESDCKAAKEAMEDGEIDGSKVTLDYAKPKGEGGFRGGRGGGGGGRGGFGGGRGGFRGGRGGFGGRGGGRGGGGRGGRGGGRGGFGGGRGGGGFGGKPQGKKIKFDD